MKIIRVENIERQSVVKFFSLLMYKYLVLNKLFITLSSSTFLANNYSVII